MSGRSCAKVTAVLVVLCGVVGLAAGLVVARAAASFPWTAGPPSETPPPGPAVPAPLVATVTALLFVLAALRFGVSAELPAYLVLAADGVLLAVVDLRHRLLPNRVVGPALVAGALLLTGAAAVDGRWDDLTTGGPRRGGALRAVPPPGADLAERPGHGGREAGRPPRAAPRLAGLGRRAVGGGGRASSSRRCCRSCSWRRAGSTSAASCPSDRPCSPERSWRSAPAR